VLHDDVKVVALAREIDQYGVPFGRINPKLVPDDGVALGYCRCASVVHDIEGVNCVRIGHVWRGKPKVGGVR
jgi:hypothetical protein